MESQQALQHQEMLLKEFDALRKELAEKQKERLHILGFTVASIGTILGLTASQISHIGTDLDYFVFALVCFGLGMLIIAQVITIHYTQWIRHVAAYIRIYIETHIDGLNWETRLNLQREKYSHYKRSWLGTGKMLAYYYGFLTCAIVGIAIVANLHHFILSIVVVSALLVISIGSALNLYFHISKGWTPRWEEHSSRQ